MKKSFNMQKESIKEKTKKLSEICDVKACAVIVRADGTVETWPENRNDVREVIQMYKNCDRKRKRPQELDRDSKANQELLRMIDAKLAQVKKRIQFLKSNDQGSNQDGAISK
ncbi:agamous-like MADS-box protein AGL81 [Forsythia ovata]|uniref:Agamous-like MADS-box protein AGL81 n=1 Tax=Forsythia ovata TaxID=205694 RepID=A0ABD1U484_9LAMI